MIVRPALAADEVVLGWRDREESDVDEVAEDAELCGVNLRDGFRKLFLLGGSKWREVVYRVVRRGAFSRLSQMKKSFQEDVAATEDETGRSTGTFSRPLDLY